MKSIINHCVLCDLHYKVGVIMGDPMKSQEYRTQRSELPEDL